MPLNKPGLCRIPHARKWHHCPPTDLNQNTQHHLGLTHFPSHSMQEVRGLVPAMAWTAFLTCYLFPSVSWLLQPPLISSSFLAGKVKYFLSLNPILQASLLFSHSLVILDLDVLPLPDRFQSIGNHTSRLSSIRTPLRFLCPPPHLLGASPLRTDSTLLASSKLSICTGLELVSLS